MSGKQWEIPYRPITAADYTGAYPPLLEAVLALRGIPPEEAEEFLHPSIGQLGDPMELKDMPRAVQRIRQAIDAGETVAVYGDYDVDGITSLCLLVSYLRSRDMTCLAYIPNRLEEGYGVNLQAIDQFKAAGVTLIITVDCGITAMDEVEYARDLGIDMVITDHHECRGFDLPKAVAVVNPKREDCTYGYDGFAGCGVAFKLVCALSGDTEEMLRQYADLVAMGTVADMMPLLGENRFLVHAGLTKLIHAPRPGLAALIHKTLSPGKELTSSSISFSLAPRINAAGRMGQSDFAVRLMMTKDPQEAEEIAQTLCDLNLQRQALEQEIWQEAVDMVGESPAAGPLVLASEHWHKGIVGITASRLAEKYNVPSIMICLDGEEGKGSCRSYGDFDLFAALAACADHLKGFGGHALAAGLTLDKRNLDAFRSALEEYYLRTPKKDAPQLVCELHIGDAALLSLPCVEALEAMEPYGSGNAKPLMCITGAVLEQIIPIGGGKHLRLKLRRGNVSFDCVYFAHSTADLEVAVGDRVDAAFSPQVNRYRDQNSVQFLISDLRRTDEFPLCQRLLAGEDPAPIERADLVPSRKELGVVWRKLTAAGQFDFTPEDLARQAPAGIPPAKYCVCLRVFREVGLAQTAATEGHFTVRVIPRAPSQPKADLNSSPFLQLLKQGNR